VCLVRLRVSFFEDTHTACQQFVEAGLVKNRDAAFFGFRHF
jgi:hypothetical protein